MAYGTIKVDTITFTDGGVDKSVSVSGLVENPTFTGNVTATGTISGDIVRGQTISGVTVTGTTANFTSGNFTNISGGTHTITSGVFALGTAANPSISFVSDPNSGLYSPGADQVAISTNGTGRLFVNSSGDLSIGTSTAGTKFHAVGGNVWSSNFFEVGRFQKSNGTGVSLGYDNTSYVASIGAYSHDGTASSLSFWTYPGTGNLLERMRLDSSGRLGLGTSSPATQFSVQNASTSLGIETDTTSGFATGPTIRGYYRAGSAYTTLGLTGSAVAFGINDVEKMRLTSTGLGIGTTSPAVAFQVGATGSGGAAIDTTNSALHGTFGTGGGLSLRAQISSSSGGGDIFLGGSSRGDANVNSIVFSTANTSRAKIDANGYFTVSSNRFNGFEFIDSGATIYHSFGSGGNLTLRAQTTATAGGGEIFLGGSTRGDSNVNTIVFSGANSERARIDSSGRLLIGTSTSRGNNFSATNQDMRFQVEGTDYLTSGASFTSNANASDQGPHIVLNRSRGSTIGSNTIVQNSDNLGYIFFEGNDGVQFVRAASIEARVDGTPGANDMPGRLVFSTTADGASIPTERMRISSGGQVFIGTTSGNSSYQVIVGGDAPGGGAGGIYVSCDGVGDANYLSASDNIGFHFYSAGASSKFFYVENDGDVRNTNNSYGAISDLKLKQDIEDAGSQWNDLKAVQVRKFRFKSNPDDALHIGVIAQELESVSPGLIDETIDRDQEGNDLGTVTKSVKYSVLYMKAVKALQEAMERIEVLEQRLTDAGIA